MTNRGAEQWKGYCELVRRRPDAFVNTDPTGIVILTEEGEVRAAEATLAERMRSRGYPADWGRAGLFYEDPYLYLVRDVVRFPDGTLGTYHHVVLKGGRDGVVILPVYQGKILLLRHFRNAIRRWSLEIPRGAPVTGRTAEDNAIDELRDELGCVPSKLIYLGGMENNNGMVSETMHAYLAEVASIGSPNHGEGIVDYSLVEPTQLAEMIATGRVSDVHTIVAFTFARLKGCLSW